MDSTNESSEKKQEEKKNANDSSQSVTAAAEAPRDVKPSDDLITADGKNAKTIYCKVCGCTVLKPGMSTLVQKKIFLHLDRKTGSGDTKETEGEYLEWFWLATNMLDFENVGFSHTVATLDAKFLTCADCEKPCFGIQFLDPGQQNNFYVASSRVSYQSIRS